MNKELQDKAWSCLPKEVREYIITEYCNAPNTEWHKGYCRAIENLYGYHNLTSDTESEEMLVAKADDVRDFYDKAQLLKGYKIGILIAFLRVSVQPLKVPIKLILKDYKLVIVFKRKRFVIRLLKPLWKFLKLLSDEIFRQKRIKHYGCANGSCSC